MDVDLFIRTTQFCLPLLRLYHHTHGAARARDKTAVVQAYIYTDRCI